MFASSVGIVLAACSLANAEPVKKRKKPPSNQEEIQRISALLAVQTRQLALDEAHIAEQDTALKAQADAFAELRSHALSLRADASISAGRSSSAAGDVALPGTQVTPLDHSATIGDTPAKPVGQAPDTSTKTAEVGNALPEGLAVLTPRHHFMFEPSIEYDRSSSNRVVFQGVEIVPGLQLGLLNSNAVNRDLAVATGTFRYGLTDRLEVEVRAPFVYRHDLLTTLAQQVTSTTAPVNQTQSLEGANIGDVEATVRYQFNRGLDNRPIFIGTFRVKSDTGVGPYDVKFDSGGVAQTSPTGSGFFAVEPGLTLLYATDPVVLFANVGYLKSFSRDINKTIGTTLVGRVDPGDSIDAGFGFGFALNSAFSFSLGFSNSYIMGTRQILGGVLQRSNDLEVGALTMGWSYRFANGLNLANNFEFGVTPDAPNLRMIFRTPIVF